MARDYSSIYTIQEFFSNEIAPKYFNLSEISMNNVGLYGMITDIIGTTTEDAFNVTNRYINEIMPSRAELPDFIYSNAALYGVTDILAKCAKMPFVLFVRESDVINNGEWSNNRHTFEIDSEMIVYLDELPYSIPHNIVITSTIFRGVYSHRAYYKEKYINNLYNDLNPYIKIFKTVVNGEYWLGLRVDLYQYIRRTTTESIITNSVLNIPYVEVSYSDQLANFEVYYKPYGSDTYTQLEKLMETSVPKTSPFVYYKLIDNDTIRLSFANDDRYFVPGYNSTIMVQTYETQGTTGNFKLYDNAEISIVPNSEVESLSYNKSVSFFGLMQNDSKGGRAQLDKEEIKRLYLEKMISIDSYTTDTDLNLHFLNYAELYNNDALFIKYRDDYANREYGCFARLTDGTDIYPTNTLDLRLNIDEVDKHFESLRQYIIKPGARYGYESDTERGVIVKLPDDAPPQEIEYTTFALTVISIRPNSVNYYMNSVNKTVQLDYSYMNVDSILNFLVGDCTISRNAILGEDSYKIGIEITRVDGITSVINGDDEVSSFEVDPTKLKVLMIFDTNQGHYVDMTLVQDEESTDNNTFKFETELFTSDMIDDERIQILNLNLRENGDVEERIINMYNPGVTFCVFYDYDDPVMNAGNSYSDIEIVKNHSLCNSYTPLEDEFYFAYPLTLMRSHVKFEEDLQTEAGWRFYLKQVPLFGKDFLFNIEDNTEVLDDIISQHSFLVDTLEDITANFTINMKFYNTYGRSRLFYLGTDDTKLLNRVNSKISLKIKFYDGIVVENYLPIVKVFIKNYLEGLNTISEGANKFCMSILTQKLHNEFDCIEAIIFEGFNDYDPEIQNVQLKSMLTELVDPNTVPEFLTITENDIKITTVTSL